jgi:cystathionine beta-lyase
MSNADMPTDAQFDAITLESLRRIGGAKWSRFGPETLGAYVAEMDFGAAPVIAEALHAMVDDAKFGYLPPRLGEELSAATADFYGSRYGWAITPEQVHTLPDVLKGLEIAIERYSRPGSPVILPTPAYMPFLSIPPSLDREIIQVPMIDTDGYYTFDLDALGAAFAAGGHLLILCNPYNPLGRVFTREELVALSEVVAAGGGRVFSDEIHAPLVFAGHKHVPYASVSDAAAGHTITAASASKAWNLAGLKCAQMIFSNDADSAHWEEIGPRPAHGAAMPGVLANIAAYRSGGPWLEHVLGYLDTSRTYLGELLATHLPKVRYVAPEGTYLAWLDFRAYGLDDELAEFFVERADVAMNNGLAFGPVGAGFVRFNFGTSRPIIEKMILAMAAAVNDQP